MTLHICEHPLVQHKIALLRAVETSTRDFRALSSELAGVLAYEATRDLMLEDVTVQTPIKETIGRRVSGKKVGVVDHVQGNAIKLTKKDSPDGQHHFIPVGWVERVDSHVHLTQNSKVTEENWKSDEASCGCGG